MDWMDIEFSTDLVNSAYLHLCFLDKVDNFEKILKGAALKHARGRYEQLWIPFAHENRYVEMVAPVDIYWLWYIHMLQPLAYRRDCRKMLKSTLDHQFKNENRIIPGINNAIELWYGTYPKEGFNIIRNGEYVEPKRNTGQVDMTRTSKLSVDLVSLAETHMHFCYQVALPHFRDRKYLENAEKRYKQFLCLKRLEPDEFLTPSVDILLMWYTHMCNPVAYAKDLMHICGRILDNNVKVKPALINDRFILAREKTTQLWKRVSGEELVQPGTKLRSSEGRKQILQMTDDDLTDSCVVVYRIRLGHAEIKHLPSAKQNQYLNLKILRLSRGRNLPEEMLFLHGTKQMWSFSSTFLFNTVQHKELNVVLSRQDKFWCLRDEKTLASATVDVKSKLGSMRSIERNISLNIDLKSENDEQTIKLIVDGAADRPVPVLCDLTLNRTDFSMQKLTNMELRRVWGHEGFPESFKRDEHVCFSATHIMKNHENEDSFRCRIMHIPELLHSGIEVCFKKKLTATSHLIGSSQLPYPSQVETQDVTMAFDPELGERAMLIRNHAGDWGLCIGRWMEESGGFLDVRFMKLAGKNNVQRLEVRRTAIEFQSFNADLYSGKLMINPGKNTLAENIATFWSICILYVLCSPGEVNRKLCLNQLGERSINGDNISNSGEEIQPVFAEESICQFLIAAGLTTEIPSNKYVRAKYGSLTYDLLIDAQDIIVEEQKTSKKLLKKDSVLSIVSDEDSQKKRRKKRKSKLKGDGSEVRTRVFIEPTAEEMAATNKSEPETTQIQKSKQITEKDDANIDSSKVIHVKPKRVRKRQSSKLEDMLVMSDDSITKDEVIETKHMKDKHGKRIIIRKISSKLDEEIAPSEDSYDEEMKEIEEFKQGLDVDRVSDVPLSGDESKLKAENGEVENKENKLSVMTSLNVHPDGEPFKREETTLIKGVVEKRKLEAADKENRENSSRLDNTHGDTENASVNFYLDNVVDEKQSTASFVETSDSVLDENRSDASGNGVESRSQRKKRLAKDRENRLPLSDEDLLAHDNLENSRRRRKRKSKQKMEIPPTNSDNV